MAMTLFFLFVNKLKTSIDQFIFFTAQMNLFRYLVVIMPNVHTCIVYTKLHMELLQTHKNMGLQAQCILNNYLLIFTQFGMTNDIARLIFLFES